MQFVYQCPVCKKALEQANKSFICKQNHTFDISREGYVNFLLANQKKTKNPGDGKLMVESRQNFLDKGYYNPLSDEINKIIKGFITGAGAGAEGKTKAGARAKNGSETVYNILDVGCGVGNYSGKLQKSLINADFPTQVELWGIDISRPAIKKASKSFPGINFCIGSSFHLPYMDESLDLVFSIFAPFDSGEVFRVLKPGGIILLIRPGTNHLKELVELIYGRFQLQGTPLDLSANFDVSPVEKYHLKYKINIRNNEDIMNLVSMTPYYWRLNAVNRERLSGLHELKTGMDFQLSLFRKNLATRKYTISSPT